MPIDKAKMDALKKKYGGGQATTTARTLTPEQKKKQQEILSYIEKKKGTTQPEQPKKEGFLKSVYRGIVEMPAKMGVGAYNVVKATQATAEAIKGVELKNGKLNIKYDKDKLIAAERELRKERNVPTLGLTKKAVSAEGTAGSYTKEIVGGGAVLASNLFGGGALKQLPATFGKQILKSAGKEAVLGATAGALYGAGTAASENKSVGSILGQGAIGGAAGGILGGTLGATLPVGQKAFGAGKNQLIKTFAPAAKKAEVAIKQGVEKGIKPYFGGKTTPALLDNYTKRAGEAIETINEYKPKLLNENTGILETRNPQNRKELLEAIDQTKSVIFGKYDELAQRAGAMGVKFDAKNVINKLSQIADPSNLSYEPEVRNYAAKMIKEIGELNGASPQVIQSRIKSLNESLSSFFMGRTDKAKARVDASIAAVLREDLDNVISLTTDKQYQALKNKYGALKAIEKDVARQVNLEMRKTPKGLIDFTDIFTGGDLIGGVLTANPALVAKGVAARGIKEIYKWLNNPNRYIKNMFKAVEKVPKLELAPKISPKISGLLPERASAIQLPKAEALPQTPPKLRNIK